MRSLVIAMLLATLPLACKKREEPKKDAPPPARPAPEGFSEARARGVDLPSGRPELWLARNALFLEPKGPALAPVGPDGVITAGKTPHMMMIAPLAAALRARAPDGGHGELVVHADARATYRALAEVAYTATQVGFERIWIATARDDGGEGGLLLTPPKATHVAQLGALSNSLDGALLKDLQTPDGGAPTKVDSYHPTAPSASAVATAKASADPCEQMGLQPVLLVSDGGYTLKARGGNVGTGCNGVGPGVTVPKKGNQWDAAAVASCLVKLRTIDKCFEKEREITLMAPDALEIQPLVTAWDAVRNEPARFDDVHLAIGR